MMDKRELRHTLDTHEKIRRAYADDRFPPARGSLGADLRMFAITVLWVCGIERPPPGGRWKRVGEILHLDDRRFWWTIKQDLPRWEPAGSPMAMGACEAPMIRRAGECGQRSCTSFRVTDPATGTWHYAAFCRRHEDYSQEVHRAEQVRMKAGGIPDPVPNAGGLLPCYFNWTWADAYTTASLGTWNPPRVGICADDWPVMARVVAMEPPKLVMHTGGVQAGGGPDPQDERLPPSLRLVRDDS